MASPTGLPNWVITTCSVSFTTNVLALNNMASAIASAIIKLSLLVFIVLAL